MAYPLTCWKVQDNFVLVNFPKLHMRHGKPIDAVETVLQSLRSDLGNSGTSHAKTCRHRPEGPHLPPDHWKSQAYGRRDIFGSYLSAPRVSQ